MSFKAEIKASLGWNWSDGATDNARLDFARQLLDGNGDDEAEAVWHIEDQTLVDGTSTTLDLTALAQRPRRSAHGDVACGQGPVDRQPGRQQRRSARRRRGGRRMVGTLRRRRRPGRRPARQPVADGQHAGGLAGRQRQ